MLGSQELILILVVLLVVFGPKRLPEMAKELGRAIQAVNQARTSIVDAATSALQEDESESKIVKIARNLEIDADGKSPKQLLGEIEKKMVKNQEGSDIDTR